jgi:arsenate reductase (thioredoxin)
MKNRVLFLCVHNSARSQIAEAFLNKYGSDQFEAKSAGMDPRPINPYVVTVMNEEGIDLTGKVPQSAFNYYRSGELFDYYITVCAEDVEEMCPAEIANENKDKWSFEDPSVFKGPDGEVLELVRDLRDRIKQKVLRFIETSE